MITDLTKRALAYATEKHKGQFRKFKGEPYIMHPKAVADMVGCVIPDEKVIAAAFLHDVLEDTDATRMELYELFGLEVTEMVDMLTNHKNPNLNRKQRKELQRKRLGGASFEVKSIKLADRIHNLPSIITHDPGFAKLYVAESIQLLTYIGDGHADLVVALKKIISDYQENH